MSSIAASSLAMAFSLDLRCRAEETLEITAPRACQGALIEPKSIMRCYNVIYVLYCSDICCAPLQVGPIVTSHSQSIPLVLHSSSKGTFFVLNRHRLQPNGRESHVSAWSLTCFTAFLTVLTTLEGGWFARTTF